MKIRNIYGLILIYSVAMLGLLFMQILWVKTSFDKEQKILKQQLFIIVSQHEAEFCTYALEDQSQAFDYLKNEILADISKLGQDSHLNLHIGKEHGKEANEELLLNYTLHCSSFEGKELRIYGFNNYWGANGFINLWSFISLVFLILVAWVLVASLYLQVKHKRLELLKSEFVSNMTHELKTPIASISLASEMLISSEEKKLSKEKEKRYLNIIHSENNRLKLLVNRVLQLSLFEKGAVDYKMEEIDVQELIFLAIHKTQLLLQEKSGALQFMEPKNSININGDKAHLLNVFINLIENSIKYADEAPQIFIKIITSENQHIIQIEDNGPGMADSMKKSAFQQFSRGRTGNIHNVKGFGLGLYYVKKVVLAHGGNIVFKDNKPKGLIAELSFPILLV